MVESLLDDASGAEVVVDDAGGSHTADGDIDPTELRAQRRVLRLVRKGELGKALKSSKPCAVANSSLPEVQAAAAQLNPQHGAQAAGGALTEDLLADVDGVVQFKPTKKVFDRVMSSPPRERGRMSP